MRKFFLIILCMIFIVQGFIYSDNKKKIGELGDKAWESLINKYKNEGKYADLTKSSNIVRSFKDYEGKLMKFPKVNFHNTITDKYNKRYYYYGEKNSLDYYVVRYNNEIRDIITELTYIFGSLTGDYEILGVVEDAYTWWGNVVLMDIRAIRKSGQVCILIENGKAKLVGKELVDAEMKNKEQKSSKGIPQNLKSIPKGLDPLTVAKLYFHIGSIEKNYKVWLDLLSDELFSSDRKYTKSQVDSWWKTFSSSNNKTYFYVREDKDKSTKDKRRYYFQRVVDRKNERDPFPITVILEKGEWKVLSTLP